MAATAVHVRSPGPARARRLPRVGDDRLVARVRAGDDSAFEIIFDRYYGGLLAFCGHMLGSRQEAEDALQHSFASAYRALRAGAGGDIELRPWLYTIARNRCLSALRAQRARLSADGLEAEPGPFEGMSAQVQLRADLRELVDELQRLPDDQRAALVLFELGDESHAEIAAVLGVRREKVKALVFQAREALMRAREAREAPCVDIREQLATVTGRVPRRSMARRHIDRCPGCAQFEREVRHQRAALAAILPVVPTVGLKASVLGFAVGGGSAVALGGAGAGGGATVAAGGALAAGGLGGGGVAGSAGAAAAGAIGTAGAATVATGLATGGGGMGLASLPAKGVVAKILSVVALGGGGAQAQVHSHRLPQPPAIHETVVRPSTPARAPTYPPAPERRLPASAHAPTPATVAADPPAAPPEVSAAPPASSPVTTSHAPAPAAPAAPSSSAPASGTEAAATPATSATSDPTASPPAAATAAPASAPATAAPSATPASTIAAPGAATVASPAPTPDASSTPSAAAPTDSAAAAPTPAPAADLAAVAASSAAVAAS